MGCGLSQTKRSVNIRINILDSEFLMKQNNRVRDKMDKLCINYETYVSLDKMIEDMLCQYRNIIITNEQFLPQLQKQLTKLNLFPNVFVRSNNKRLSNIKQNTNTFNLQYFNSYEEFISSLTNKILEKQNVENNFKEQQNRLFHVQVKILKQSSISTQTELEMIKEALRMKSISFKIYHSFIDFEKSLSSQSCDFIICDYQYHRQVLNTISDPTKTRTICVCQFTKKQTYDSRLYFIADNWRQIINEISKQQKWSHLNFVKCSKVFMYAQNEKSLANYAETIQALGFDVRIYSNLGKIGYQSKYYFAISVIVNVQDYDKVKQYMIANDFWFKTKLIVIEKQTQNTIKSLHNVVMQLKRGYRGMKSTTRSIDIIDKHLANNPKYSVIREQFAKNKIRCCMYNNIDEYISCLKYISPYVIVNEEESALLLRFLRQVRATTKVVMFCHKNNTPMGEVKNQHAFCIVTDNFGKILNFIKSNPVYNPLIPDLKRLEFKGDDDDFDKVNPSQIQQQEIDLQSYKITKYTTTTFNKSRR